MCMYCTFSSSVQRELAIVCEYEQYYLHTIAAELCECCYSYNLYNITITNDYIIMSLIMSQISSLKACVREKTRERDMCCMLLFKYVYILYMHMHNAFTFSLISP